MQGGIWKDPNTFMQFAKEPGFLGGEIATRDRAPDYMALMNLLPNPDPVLKKMGKDITVYRDILSDSHVGAVESSRKAGVLSMEWEIDRGTAKSRHAKFVQELFEDFDMDRIIGEILDAPLFGYQPMEVIWKSSGNFVLPVDVVGKPQEWFGFGADNELRFFTKDNSLGVPVPERRFLLPRHRPTYQNPYGKPLLALCFWWFTFKKGGIKYWVSFMEKYGMPFAVGKLPAGTDQKRVQDLLSKLSRMVQDAVAVIPDDSSAEIINTDGKTASADIYKGMADFCNAEMSKAIIGHAGGADSTPGKLGGEDNALAVRGDLITADKRLVERTLNQLIDWIVWINFGEAERPRFNLFVEDKVDETLSKRDKTLTETGVKFTKKYYEKNHKLEAEDFDLAANVAPAAVTPAPVKENAIAIPPAERKPEPAVPAAAFSATPATPPARVLSPHAFTVAFSKVREAAGYADQDALDAALEGLPAETLQAFAEGMLKPIFKLIEKKATAEQLSDALAEAYPEMDDTEFQQYLAQAIFVTELYSRAVAGAE